MRVSAPLSVGAPADCGTAITGSSTWPVFGLNGGLKTGVDESICRELFSMVVMTLTAWSCAARDAALATAMSADASTKAGVPGCESAAAALFQSNWTGAGIWARALSMTRPWSATLVPTSTAVFAVSSTQVPSRFIASRAASAAAPVHLDSDAVMTALMVRDASVSSEPYLPQSELIWPA